MQLLSVSLFVFYGTLSVISAAVIDEGLSSALQSHVRQDRLFFSLRDVRPPRRPPKNTHQVLLSVALPSHHRLALTLDRSRGKVVIETIKGGSVERQELVSNKIRPHSTLDSILVDLSQTERTATVYIDCEIAGTLTLSKSLRDMAADSSQITVYRSRNIDISIDWDVNILQLLDKLGCNNDIDKDIQAQSNEIYTYRRGDIPVIHEDEKASILVKTLTSLIETIRELQVEIQTQREETALLRDALINCQICKPGRDFNL